MYLEVSNVFTPIATRYVFVSAKSMLLVEEGTLISEYISEFSDVSLENVVATEPTAGEKHFAEYAMAMTDFLVIGEPHAIATFEMVFTKEQVASI